MALKDANLIPFQLRQRQFLKEVFCSLPKGYKHNILFEIIKPADTFQWVFGVLTFISD